MKSLQSRILTMLSWWCSMTDRAGCGKIPYPSRRAAQDHLKGLLIKGQTKKRRTMGIYPCKGGCRGPNGEEIFHVGHNGGTPLGRRHKRPRSARIMHWGD